MTRQEDVAVFPGSFDPLTYGHTDIITRSLKIFDKLIVAVLANPNKQSFFQVSERVELIREVFADYKDRIVVDSFSGLLVDFVRKNKGKVVIRGLRAISDYDYEAQMALTNRNISSEQIETFFLITSEANSYISSSIVKQVATLGGDVSKFVPPIIEKAIKAKFKK